MTRRRSKRAVFLDRDGVLNPDTSYSFRVEDAVLFPEVPQALQLLQQAGWKLVVVSNQSGIARGYYGTRDVERFNTEIIRQLARYGIRMSLEDFYICPHLPDDNCDCRKPLPGLILRAASDHLIETGISFTVGDRETDILAGQAAGTQTILIVRSGERAKRTGANHVVCDLLEAATLIVTGTRPVPENG